MLNGATAFSGYSTNDVPKAKAFYANTLGLNVHRGERRAQPEVPEWPDCLHLPEGQPRTGDIHDAEHRGRRHRGRRRRARAPRA